MRKPLRGAAVFSSLALAAIVACSSSTETSSSYTSASCNACTGGSYTQADCNAIASQAGCDAPTLVSDVPGCTNGCKFTNCVKAPACTQPKDAGAGVDAASDPECAAANQNTIGKGLFPQKPTACPGAHEGNVNGTPIWTCPCGGTCPCGYECGSIPLSVGGSIGSVCAPVR